MKSILKQVFEESSIKATDHQLEMFEKYAELLLEWNQKINLTAITQWKEIAVKHFCDSVTLINHLRDVEDCRLIDIGSGAGFPGVPLRIMRPGLKLTLMDSLQKRVRFLCELVDALGLTDTQVIHMRAEDGASDGIHREKYDIAVSRAVAGLDILSVYSLGYVKVGGQFIAMKGPEPEQEIRGALGCIKKMGGEINSVENVILPLNDIKHSIILIDKVRETPREYPKKLLKIIKNTNK